MYPVSAEFVEQRSQDALKKVLKYCAATKRFSSLEAPVIFIVYAHDPEDRSGPELAFEGLVRNIAVHLKLLGAKIIYDKQPLCPWESGTNDNGAVHNIVSNQIRLLPDHEGCVRKVIVVGSPLLEKYHKYEWVPPYLQDLKSAFATHGAETNRLRETVQRQFRATQERATPERFHHILTELAFLQIRFEKDKIDHGIIPLRIDGSPMLYLRDTEPDLLHIRFSSKDGDFLQLFFKLLERIYDKPEQYQPIKISKDFYSRYISILRSGDTQERIIEKLEQEDQVFERDRRNEDKREADRQKEQIIVDQCLSDLRITDPRHDKKRIEQTKDGLLADSYVWILQTSEFCQWRDQEDEPLLWVEGNAGKGKTMLLCGIINELEKPPVKGSLLSYFFCQYDDDRLHNATAVLRGLIYMLLQKKPSLISHLQEKHKAAGKALFEGPNAWQALNEIFMKMLGESRRPKIRFVVDALDECVEDRPQLLDLIVRTSTTPGVKWLVSSRNWSDIKEKLRNRGLKLSLETHAKHVSAAVDTYIKYKVSQLERKKRYRGDTAEEVRQYLSENAGGTFLWVALVCKELSVAFRWDATQMMKRFPPGLKALYQQMMGQIFQSHYGALCQGILAVAATAYRPLSLAEMSIFVQGQQDVTIDMTALHDVIELCRSLLVVREQTIYFVHKSASEFVHEEEQSDKVFPHTRAAVHCQIVCKSIHAMSKTLKRDMYELQDPGFPIEDISQQRPDPDPLARIEYSCVHWVRHLIKAIDAPNYSEHDEEEAIGFLRDKGLYWIESLSLLQGVFEGMFALEDLEPQLKESSRLRTPVVDTLWLLKAFWPAIESWPLQAYASALVFTPVQSELRNRFAHEAPQWIECKTGLANSWSDYREAGSEDHTLWVNSVAFSADGRRVISTSWDRTVRLWDAATGACEVILQGHTRPVYSAAFSANGQRVVSASGDQTVRIWDATTGSCEVILQGHTHAVNSATFSADGRRVVSSADDHTVRLWDAIAGHCLKVFEIGYPCSSVLFDSNGTSICADGVIIPIDNTVPRDPDQGLPQPPTDVSDYSLSPKSCAWIQHKSHSVLFLPEEYRPTCSAITVVGEHTKLILGCVSGRVCTLHLSPP